MSPFVRKSTGLSYFYPSKTENSPTLTRYMSVLFLLSCSHNLSYGGFTIMKKAIIYTRTSPDLVSVRTQIVACKLFAKLNGVEVQRICHDPGENDRKVLLDLLRNSDTAKWDCILILDPSVLCEDLCTFLKYREKFNLSGKRVLPVVNHKEENK